MTIEEDRTQALADFKEAIIQMSLDSFQLEMMFAAAEKFSLEELRKVNADIYKLFRMFDEYEEMMNKFLKEANKENATN
jgi:hypothetical protein